MLKVILSDYFCGDESKEVENPKFKHISTAAKGRRRSFPESGGSRRKGGEVPDRSPLRSGGRGHPLCDLPDCRRDCLALRTSLF